MKHFSTTDTAKLIRAELKAKFPGVKFSVKSSKYSGGSSIRVSWTDGPTTKLVDAVVQPFAGATFDGMTDSKDYITGELDGEPVKFGADFIFAERGYSEAALNRTLTAYAHKNNDELADAIRAGSVRVEDGWIQGARDIDTDGRGMWGDVVLYRERIRRMLPLAG